MLLHIEHRTRYRYDQPMRHVTQSLRLQPSRFEGQRVIDWNIAVDGASFGSALTDGAGDQLVTMSLFGPVGELLIDVTGTVETVDCAGVLRGHREAVPVRAYLRSTLSIRPDEAVRSLAAQALTGSSVTDGLDRAHRLATAVADAIVYQPGSTHAQTTAAQALAAGQGVCQDHAHVLIAAAHCAGLPARYVIGYLHSSADGHAHQASHAWAEIHVAALGWVGFDAANRCCPDERYVRLGSGQDALQAAPIRGVSRGVGVEVMEVDVAIRDSQQQ